MGRDSFGPFRCKLPRKPWIKHARIIFYGCANCGRILYEFVPEYTCAEQAGTEASSCIEVNCCGQPMVELAAKPAGDDLAYQIFGGFNHNAVKAMWSDRQPLWVLLQTYTGASLKQLDPQSRRSQAIFPLSENDAYVYCDRDVCEKCLYCCKKGCNLYFYFGNNELRILPLDQISPYFKT